MPLADKTLGLVVIGGGAGARSLLAIGPEDAAPGQRAGSVSGEADRFKVIAVMPRQDIADGAGVIVE